MLDLKKYDNKRTITSFCFFLQNKKKWHEMAINGIAGCGYFSSDRAVTQYAKEIWGVEPTWEKQPSPAEHLEE